MGFGHAAAAAELASSAQVASACCGKKTAARPVVHRDEGGGTVSDTSYFRTLGPHLRDCAVADDERREEIRELVSGYHRLVRAGVQHANVSPRHSRGR
jgi:hypothetical protein